MGEPILMSDIVFSMSDIIDTMSDEKKSMSYFFILNTGAMVSFTFSGRTMVSASSV